MGKNRVVLITGGTGLLGKGFEESALPGWEIVGMHLRDYKVPGSRMRQYIADVRDPHAVERVFQLEHVDAVVHAAGMASVDQVEKSPEDGRASNLQGTRNIAEACRRQAAYMVYISTNAVFDGKSAPYREDAQAAPLHHYGRIKLECEGVASALCGGCAIARPILMYGWNHPMNRTNPVSWVYDRLRQGQRVQLVDDVFENPLQAQQCGRALWAMLEKKPSGVFHLAGASRVNRYELGLRTATAFGLDATLIDRVDSSFFPTIVPRPKDTTFVTERMERELGIKPLTLEEGLGMMRSELETTH